jgi:hypothetical protein
MQRSTLLGGALLAVAASLLCLIGEALGLDTQHVALLGGAMGGVIGLVPDRSPTMRVIGFVAGLFVAWIGFAVRALYLPDSTSGRALAAFLVVAACLGITAAVGSQIPLWSLLLGAAAMVAVYEEAYTADSPAFLSESPGAATGVLLAAAIGFLATTVLGPQVSMARHRDGALSDDQPTQEFATAEGDSA